MSISFTATWGPQGNPTWGEDINVAQVNAGALMALLGYGDSTETYMVLGVEMPVIPEPVGEATPADLLGRIAVARWGLDASTDDEHGKPALADGGPATGRALVIDLGRAAGYFAEKLDALEDVARDAAAHGGKVVWG